jgi:predicted helicase
MLQENLAISTTRSVEIGNYEHVFCSRRIIGHHTVSLKEVNYLFPLYLYSNKRAKGISTDNKSRYSNLKKEFIREISEKIKLKFIEDGQGDLKSTFGPEDVFYYIYAILHSNTYRSRYKEFLKFDFPRIPVTSDSKLFTNLVARGSELVALHLMESPILRNYITKYLGTGPNSVESIKYKEHEGRVYINKKKYFEGIEPAIWNFRVGGYQVCKKWLLDRKGRTLKLEDLEYYQRMIVAIKETIHLMDEVDASIPSWPVE